MRVGRLSLVVMCTLICSCQSLGKVDSDAAKQEKKLNKVGQLAKESKQGIDRVEKKTRVNEKSISENSQRIVVLEQKIVEAKKGIAERSLEPVKLDYDKMNPPGFFDVGIGFGQVFDTRGENDDDSSGIVLSFKAYPYGRWYGEARDDPRLSLDNKAIGTISIISQFHKSSGGQDKKALPPEIKKEVEDLLNNPNVFLWHEERLALSNAVEAKQGDLAPGDSERIDLILNRAIYSPKWHIVRERDSVRNRLAFFYARSVSDFDNGGLDSEVNAFGVSYDVSPELAILFGVGFYETEDSSGKDSDNSEFIGISLNLFAFEFFSGLGGSK